MKTRMIFWLFVVTSIANIIAKVIESSELNQFTKPLLMPILLFYIYRSTKGRVTGRVLLLSLAILLSWIGDVALMYEGELFFMVGIGFFLLAQVIYIIVLNKSSFQQPSFDTLKVLPFAIYAIGLFRLLVPNAGGLKIPIIIYGIVISVMAGMARLREGNTSQISYRLALYGSLFFLVSDSLLAINKFYYHIPLSGVWVMSTYCIAQFLLVEGLIKHVD